MERTKRVDNMRCIGEEIREAVARLSVISDALSAEVNERSFGAFGRGASKVLDDCYNEVQDHVKALNTNLDELTE